MTQAVDLSGRPVVVIAGPTCSGKSALALAVARAMDGVIINADSMQVYRDLRVLTARPSPEEEAAVPHRLYGVLPADETGSVAWWRASAMAAIEAAWEDGRLPVLCGGTGMYMRALTDGLTDIPDAGTEARAEARRLVEEEGPAALHARLSAVDPESAAALRPSDSQRVARAWEVWSGTGHGMIHWRRTATLPPLACHRVAVRLEPPRDTLRAAIARRFDAMLEAGALEEVRALLTQDLSPALPAMRAHGVPELAAHLRGDLSLEEAASRAVLATGRYTRRQTTWFAHHSLAEAADTWVIDTRIGNDAQQMERNCRNVISFILNRIDVGRQFP
ncbi:tRNA dimethylallyltransferase [Gluconacetobacter liquefaciens]|uniref:tRNA dimethylallyltransferase n=1 Tax=Gluconacetobacter liquefaciens TaxID=89584 RepID=A0A370FWT4_GLULI|nr:tRNA (adenosine(37)-N6)-dimethylallyltransferase MiaA [Gluconacetobacter liquefaciens]MBB2188228.1 tRNA (adenosine(37)-N6)-dimethylallyltransferase MiaA [Gluconacetobacter liquefaciens]RDI34128.1 tRNA dimethylallyltransferase [Gluconacetobacter liquefaciens]GEB39101.1 tRNA dimethylallyltransferase [Gluconacetobacter liquefaciens]